jgi:hypothetical protein
MQYVENSTLIALKNDRFNCAKLPILYEVQASTFNQPQGVSTCQKQSSLYLKTQFSYDS